MPKSGLKILNIRMKKFFVIFFLGGFYPGDAQQSPGSGTWLSFQAPVNFLKHWQWHNDAGYRTLGVSVLPLQYLYRTGLRYNFNLKVNAAAGVAFFFTKADYDKSHHDFGYEFRIWQEGNYQSAVKGPYKWQGRVRTEQRFFASSGGKPAYQAHRFRLRTALIRQVTSDLSLQVAVEYMQQMVSRKISFDQNRTMISVIRKLNSTILLQGGYMWLHKPADDQHIITISFIKNI